MRTTISISLLTVISFLFALNRANGQTCGTSQVTYSGYTSNYLPKWNVTNGCISNSSIFDNGNIGIGTAAPGKKFDVNGDALIGASNRAAGHAFLFLDAGTGSGNEPHFRFSQNTILKAQIKWSSDAAGGIDFYTVGVGSFVRFTNAGNVGIGTTSPLAKLHLNNGSVLFDGTTGATPTSGAGTRMMWIPAKGAFRAGIIAGSTWDDANIGTNSVAFGLTTKASGGGSVAFGSSTIASGDVSVTFGLSTTASGLCASAFGSQTTASGTNSVAFGVGTLASGMYSTSLGDNTTAQSFDSFVIGRYNTISGTTGSWVVTDPLFVIGNGSSTSVRSNALTVLKNGNVLINKTTQLNSLYKLDIDGTMRVNEIVVNLTGADFVFNNNYKLLPLKELELFIKENNHLPEIASAEEMETGDGVKIGEMQTQLLQKIEELTLYIIELNKKIETIETK